MAVGRPVCHFRHGNGIRFVVSLVFNALAVGMILMLLVWIIGADVLSA